MKKIITIIIACIFQLLPLYAKNIQPFQVTNKGKGVTCVSCLKSNGTVTKKLLKPARSMRAATAPQSISVRPNVKNGRWITYEIKLPLKTYVHLKITNAGKRKMILVPEYLSGNITTVELGKAKEEPPAINITPIKEPHLLGPLQQLRKDILEWNSMRVRQELLYRQKRMQTARLTPDGRQQLQDEIKVLQEILDDKMGQTYPLTTPKKEVISERTQLAIDAMHWPLQKIRQAILLRQNCIKRKIFDAKQVKRFQEEVEILQEVLKDKS